LSSLVIVVEGGGAHPRCSGDGAPPVRRISAMRRICRKTRRGTAHLIEVLELERREPQPLCDPKENF
jgi:hypothetical protein